MSVRTERAAKRRLNKQLKELRAEKAAIRDRVLHWGMPWCDGPRAAYHQPDCCEGCGVRMIVEADTADVNARIKALTEPKPEPVAGELMSLVNGAWVMA